MLYCPSRLSPSLLQRVSHAPFQKRHIPKAWLTLKSTVHVPLWRISQGGWMFWKKKKRLWFPLSYLSLTPFPLFVLPQSTWWHHASHATWVSLNTHGVKQNCKIKSELGSTCIYEVFLGLCLTCLSLHRWEDWRLNLNCVHNYREHRLCSLLMACTKNWVVFFHKYNFKINYYFIIPEACKVTD